MVTIMAEISDFEQSCVARIVRLSKLPLIAIVDDDDAVREAILDFLLVEGLSGRTFANGAAFLADEGIDGFDCVVTDVRMAEIDGLELQRRLRARSSSVPVIFITSSVGEATRNQALLDGAVAWFNKPVANEALMGALRAALGSGVVK